jgi:hypothetical protein
MCMYLYTKHCCALTLSTPQPPHTHTHTPSLQVGVCRRKLKVYDAFFESGSADTKAVGRGQGDARTESALQKLLKLRDLSSFEDEGKS